MNVADDLTPAREHWTMGAGHATAAAELVKLAEEDSLGGVYSASIYLLLGNAVEVLLKAAFLHLGGSLKEARIAIGHDLGEGLTAARARGFNPEKEIDWLVASLRPAHLKHSFRYMSADDFEVPEVQPATKLVFRLVKEVGGMVYPGLTWRGPDI